MIGTNGRVDAGFRVIVLEGGRLLELTWDQVKHYVVIE